MTWRAMSVRPCSKEAFEGKGFLPMPGMSIGMPEFDMGERFDLRG